MGPAFPPVPKVGYFRGSLNVSMSLTRTTSLPVLSWLGGFMLLRRLDARAQPVSIASLDRSPTRGSSRGDARRRADRPKAGIPNRGRVAPLDATWRSERSLTRVVASLPSDPTS